MIIFKQIALSQSEVGLLTHRNDLKSVGICFLFEIFINLFKILWSVKEYVKQGFFYHRFQSNFWIQTYVYSGLNLCLHEKNMLPEKRAMNLG